MNICSNGHDEVCFEGYNCPVCTTLDELLDRDKTVERLQTDLDDANMTIKQLEKEVADLNRE